MLFKILKDISDGKFNKKNVHILGITFDALCSENTIIIEKEQFDKLIPIIENRYKNQSIMISHLCKKLNVTKGTNLLKEVKGSNA